MKNSATKLAYIYQSQGCDSWVLQRVGEVGGAWFFLVCGAWFVLLGLMVPTYLFKVFWLFVALVSGAGLPITEVYSFGRSQAPALCMPPAHHPLPEPPAYPPD